MRRLHELKIDTPEYYEKIWSIEHNTRPFYDATRMRELLRHVEAHNKVVDLGAGCFGPGQYLVEKYPEWEGSVIAVDYSHTAKELISKSLAHDKRFSYVLSQADSTPLRDAYFDVVLAGELIEHFEDPRDLSAEMARLCKDDGWMVISTVDTNSENAKKHGDYPEHLWEFDPWDLLSFFENYGSPHHYIFGDYHMVECKRKPR